MIWFGLDPRFRPKDLGFLGGFLSEDDPDPAAKQIDKHYAHGGGWQSFGMDQWRLDGMTLKYPGDPPLRPLALTILRGEIVVFYKHAIVLILQPDGTFDIARID